MFTDIDTAIEWITHVRSKHNTFEHFKEVCEKLGNPQNDFYTIHVAGTNGKGSTVNYLCDLLMSQGFKVGTLTSPHYVKHQDRIRVNQENIDDDSFLDILNEYYDFFVENDLSMFMMDYLIMCEYFKREKIDIRIQEVGMGGRLDSTNVVDNTALSIITSIGFDHMEALGDTLPLICKEKCGIIKENSKVLCGKLDEECLEVVRKTCKERRSELYILDDYQDLGDRKFLFHDREYELTSYAGYQLHNASLSLYALELTAKDYGFTIDYELAKKALKDSLWRCRFEIVKEKPRVILDGGHNPHGILAAVSSFDQFEGSKCIVFSALERKQYKEMMEILDQHCDKLIVTTFPSQGIKKAIELNEIEGYETMEDYKQAIAYAMENYDNILICGSLYFMSEVVLNCHFD